MQICCLKQGKSTGLSITASLVYSPLEREEQDQDWHNTYVHFASSKSGKTMSEAALVA